MSHEEYLTFAEFNRRQAVPHTHTSATAVGIAVIAGIATLLKFLDFLGYPVWFWLRKYAHKMAMELERAVSPALSVGSASSDDTVQSGGMMGSLFGMGSSALSKGVRGVASALSRGAYSDTPAGLGNYDNSCFQNSVIQGLASLPSLRDYLEKTTAEHESFTADSTNGALLEMISQLHDPEKHGQNFWVRGKLKSMSTFQQQDAQEYYSTILDELDKEIKKATKSKWRTSVSWIEAVKSLSLSEADEQEESEKEVTNEKTETAAEQPKTMPIPMEGSLAQRVGCTTCGYSEGLSLIPFNCITVSLGRNRSGYDIHDLLDQHTDLEYIEGVECSKCTLLKNKRTLETLVAKQGLDSPYGKRLQDVQEALNDDDLKDATMIKKFGIKKQNWVKSEKSKQVVVARAPKSLVLHINRSIFDETTFAQYKNNAGVSYPSTLDLGKWCLGAKPSGSQRPDLDPKTEEWPRDPRKSMLAGADDTEPSPFQYRLRAAVTHFGTHGYGHYVCYRPHPRVVRKAAEEVEGDEESKETEDTEANGEDAAVTEGKEDQPEQLPEQNQEQTQSATEEAADAATTEADEAETEAEPQPLSSEQWYRFSDESVSAVSEEEAHQGNVFMLFYERIDDEDTSPTTPSAPATTPESALLPSTTTAPTSLNHTNKAIETALPSNDTTADTIPADTAAVAAAAQPTPPATTSDKAPSNLDTETETEVDTDADADAESAPAEPAPSTTPQPQAPQLSPTTMRTAGNKTARGKRNQGSRASLPLVSAT